MKFNWWECFSTRDFSYLNGETWNIAKFVNEIRVWLFKCFCKFEYNINQAISYTSHNKNPQNMNIAGLYGAENEKKKKEERHLMLFTKSH